MRVGLRPPQPVRRAASGYRQLADPRSSARYIRANPAPTVALLVIFLFVTNAAANGGPVLPTAEQGFAWIGGALALILVAQVAPDLITWTLALALLWLLLTNVEAVEAFVSQGTSKLGGTPRRVA